MADPVTLIATVALNAASMAMTASQHFEGPRLDSLKITNSDYGAALLYFYGTRRLDGLSVMYAEDIREEKVRHKTKGGKYDEFRYFGTFAVMIADHAIDKVLKIWFDTHLVYNQMDPGPISPFLLDDDRSLEEFMRLYMGAADQEPDPRMLATIEALHGVGACPAYRGVSYMMFEDIPLEKLGNRLPQVSVLATHNPGPAFPYEEFNTKEGGFYNFSRFAFSPDRTLAFWSQGETFEVWDVAARTPMVWGPLVGGSGNLSYQRTVGFDRNGTVWLLGTPDDPSLLTSWNPLGVGGEPVAYSFPFRAESSVYLEDGEGFGYICMTSWGDFNDGWVYDIAGADGFRINTLSATGFAWQVKFFFADGHGDIWCLGADGDLDADECAILRVINRSGRPGFGQAILTMPSSRVGGIAKVAGFHYADADVDQFVIAWNADTPSLVRVDSAMLEIISYSAISIAAWVDVEAGFQYVKPTAPSIWIGPREFSSRDLSLLRTVDFDDWNQGSGGPGAIYDRINNAILYSRSVDDVAWMYLDRADGDGVPLSDIVEDVALRCGLAAPDLDASALNQSVLGYSWTQGSGKAILEPLLEFFNSEARPHDFELQFIKRGGTGVGQITAADMGATSGGSGDGPAERYKITRTLDTDLPRRASITFADPAIDQQPNTAISQRQAVAVDGVRELSLDLSTLAATADDARAGVDAYLRRAWYGAESYELSVSRQFSALEPGDHRSLDFDGVAKIGKLTDLTFQADGVLSLRWIRDLASVHVPPTQAGPPADGVIPPVIPVFGFTRGLVLDIPLISDAHEGLNVYMAAAPYSAGSVWPGATFFSSDDGGTTFDNDFGDVASDEAATIGTAQTVLAQALPEVWDRASTLTVTLFNGVLASTTEAAVANGANLALVGDEIVGFTTATLTAPSTYELSGFLRGRRGTEAEVAGHVAGEPFVLLPLALPRETMGASDVGDTLRVKPITNGASTGFAQTLVYSGASLKPYSAAHLDVAQAGGDLVLTWIRRTRIGGAWRDLQDAALGEGSEAYEMDVLDAGGDVLRTYSGLSSPTATYTAADQATDAGAGEALVVYQISSTVGRGYPASIAI